MKNNNNKIIIITLIIINILVYHIWFDWSSIITHGDWGYLWEIDNNIFAPFIWKSVYGLGNITIDISQFIYLLMGIIGKLGISSGNIHKTIFMLFSVGTSSIGSFLLGKRIFESYITAFVVSIVFCFNTYFLTLQTGHNTLAASFSLFPLLFLIYDLFLKRLELKNFICFLLLALLMSGYEMRAFYISIIVLALYTLYYILSTGFDNKKFDKKVFILYIIGGGIVFILLQLWRYLSLSSSLGGNIASNEIFDRGLWGSGFFSLSNSITLYHPFWGFWNSIKEFQLTEIPLYAWLIPFFAWLGFFLNKKNHYIQFFGIIALLGILLSKQTQEPFTNLYVWLFNNFPGFSAFREASKFYFLVMLGYSVLIGGFVNYIIVSWNIRNYIKYLIFFMISFLFLLNTKYFITGEVGRLFISRSIPSDYEALNKYLEDSELGIARILTIPRDSRRMYFSNRYPKITIEQVMNIYDKRNQGYNIQDKILSFVGNQDFKSILDKTNTKYIIIPMVDNNNDDDFISYYGDPFSDPRNGIMTGALEVQKNILTQRSYIIHKKYYDTLASLPYLNEINIGTQDGVHIFENQGFLSNISFGRKILFTFINPTKYSLSLTIPTTSTGEELKFLQSFHSERKLYPGPSWTCDQPHTMTGQDIQYLPILAKVNTGQTLTQLITQYQITTGEILDRNTGVTVTGGLWIGQQIVVGQQTGTVREYQTTECLQSGYTFFQGEELGYLWKKPLRDEGHTMVYDYANGRDISLTGSTGSQILAQGLQEGWIRPHTDGSYQVDLVLYFRPQSWFYLGLMISGTTLIGLLSRLLYGWVRERRTREDAT